MSLQLLCQEGKTCASCRKDLLESSNVHSMTIPVLGSHVGTADKNYVRSTPLGNICDILDALQHAGETIQILFHSEEQKTTYQGVIPHTGKASEPRKYGSRRKTILSPLYDCIGKQMK